MKKIIFNDSRQIEIQDIKKAEGRLRVRMILTNRDQIKALFNDSFATTKMQVVENGTVISEYENFKIFMYIKEETGGIFEVEMQQTEMSIAEQVAEAAQKATEAQEKSNDIEQSVQMAIAELTMLVASTLPQEENTEAEGGEMDV